MNVNYAMACTEVLEILKFLPESEYSKIPKQEIEILEKNKDTNYVFTIDEKKAIEELNISKKANAILVILWKKYFASQTEQQKLNYILMQNYQKQEEMKQNKYNYDNLFKNKKAENTEIIVYEKEKWYKKLWNKIINKLWKIKK